MNLNLLGIFLLISIISTEKINCESINLIPGQPQRQKISPNHPIQLTTSNIPIKYRYAVFQAHSHIYSLILSYTDDVKTHGKYIESNNAGLVQLLQPEDTSTSVFLRSTAPDVINVYLKVDLFTQSDPIPGGCNLEFDVEISPFLKVFYDAFVTKISYQHAAVGYGRGGVPESCDVSYSLMDYDFYVYNLEEGNLNEKAYFDAISIMTDEKIMKSKAQKISPWFGMSQMIFTVTTYRRQGMIFNVVASNKTNSVPYVPNISYGCSLLNDSDSCLDLFKPFEWMLAIGGALLGLFLCFFGHRFFKTALCSFGFITTAMIVYVFLYRWAALSYPGIVAITILVGILGGIGWTFIWWISGSPLLAVLLPGFDLGFLLGCVAMFTSIGDLRIFQTDNNYWLFIACCVLLVPIILIMFTKVLHILACAVIGSFAAIFLIDCFIDGSLRYILIVVIRRATIPNYSNVNNVIPYQTSDIILTVTWLLLVIAATAIQWVRERGRPPFPLSDYRIRQIITRQLEHHQQQQREAESNPLLQNNSTNRSRGRYQSIVF